MQEQSAADSEAEAASALTQLSPNSIKRKAAAQARAQSKKDKKAADPEAFRLAQKEQQQKRRARVAAEREAAEAAAAHVASVQRMHDELISQPILTATNTSYAANTCDAATDFAAYNTGCFAARLAAEALATQLGCS